MQLGAVLLSLHVAVGPSGVRRVGAAILLTKLEPELELMQAHMAQKPVLRVEVGARALRMRPVSREGAWASAGMQGAWVSRCGCEAPSPTPTRPRPPLRAEGNSTPHLLA